MHFADLGALVVEVDGIETSYGRRTKQAVLLAVLALNANRRVSSEDLIEAAWGGRRTTTASLENQVWRLRRALTSRAEGAASPIVHDAGGYRLIVDPADVDSLVFENLARSAETLLAAAEPARALDEAERALALWRGRPYEVLLDVASAAAAIARLEEVHTQLHETRIDALIVLGRLEQALIDLEPLIAAAPFRERLWVCRMTALAGAGRTVEALESYQRIRDLLAEETGLDPGPELQQLQQRILTHDIEPQRRAAPAMGAKTTVHLPSRLNQLIGRDEDTERVSQLVVRHGLVTITGAGGTGKTRLAIEVAQRSAGSFPDGVWFIDLATVTAADLVVDLVASTLGIAATVADPMQTLATFVAGRRLLLVLDNCEHLLDGLEDCVQAILGAGAGPAVLATSREPLDVESEIIWSLSPLSLTANGGRPDAVPSASRLFVERAQAAAPGIDFDAEQLDYVDEICRSVDGLPLAIELAAARVRTLSLTEIARQVGNDPSRLARIGRARDDHRHDLYQSIEWSYRLLPAREQSLHRWLSVLPGPFTLPAAVAVARADSFEVADGLLGLAHRSLLTTTTPDTRQGSTSFAQLATIRSHARRRLVEEGDYSEALRRRDQWVKDLLRRRPRLGSPDGPAWYDALEEAYPSVRESMQRAVEPPGDPELVQLASDVAFFWYFRSRLIEYWRWLEKAHAAGIQTRGSFEERALRLRLAGTLLIRFRPDLARPHILACLEGARDVPEASMVVMSEVLVGLAVSAWSCRAFDVVEAAGRELEGLARRINDEHIRLFADLIGCIPDLPRGRFDEAGRRAEVLFTRARQAENLVVAWASAFVMCVVATETGNPVDALAWTQQVVDLQLRLGPGGSKVFLEALGNCLAAAEDYPSAVRLYSAARKEARRTGLNWPNHPQTLAMLRRAEQALGPAELEQAWRDGETLTIKNLADFVVPSTTSG